MNHISRLFLLFSLSASISLFADTYLPAGMTLERAKEQIKTADKVQVGMTDYLVLTEREKPQNWGEVLDNPALVILKGSPLLTLKAFQWFGQEVRAKFTKVKGHLMKILEEIRVERQKNAQLSGEAYARIFHKYNEPKIAQTVAAFAGTRKPVAGMPDLVRELYNQDVVLHFASNIGPSYLERLKTYIRSKYKTNYLDLIQPGKIVDHSSFGPLPGEVTNYPATGLTKYHIPSPEYHQEFNKTYNPDGNSPIVFVYDRAEFAQAAAKEGNISIHFDVSQANAMDILVKEFEDLGILPQNSSLTAGTVQQ